MYMYMNVHKMRTYQPTVAVVYTDIDNEIYVHVPTARVYTEARVMMKSTRSRACARATTPALTASTGSTPVTASRASTRRRACIWTTPASTAATVPSASQADAAR